MYLLPGSVNAAFSSGQREALGGLKLFPELTPPVEAVLFVDFAPPPPDALSSPWSPADVATIAQQRLAALALRLIAEHRNRVQAESVAYLRAASFEGASRTLQVVGASADALAGLREHQIPFTITGSPGIALEAHNPAERPFADLDILVAPADFKSASNVLTCAGYEEDVSSRPPWPWFNRLCREAVNLRSRLGGSVDLHHHLPPWLWTRHVDVRTVIAASAHRRFYGDESPCPPLLRICLSWPSTW